MRPTFLSGMYRTGASMISGVCLCVVGAISTQNTQAQSSEIFGNRYFSSTITSSDESRLQISMFHDTEDNFIVQGMPLINVISRAYETSQFLIVDGPDWIYIPRLYDIKAVPPPSFVESDNDEMLINLLADRFNLATRMASREMTGLGIELEDEDHLVEFLSPTNRLGMRFMPTPGTNFFRLEFSFDGLADFLSNELNQLVFNATGLVGTYAVEYDRGPPGPSPTKLAPILEKMGIRLESQETEVNVLEISRIEHPDIDD